MKNTSQIDHIKCKAIAYSNKLKAGKVATDKGQRRKLHKFLKSKGLYERFRSNVAIHSYCNVYDAFVWRTTKEGSEFWSEIDSEFLMFNIYN